MLFYNVNEKEISFYTDDKRLGRITIPSISSSLFKSIFIKTSVFLFTSNFPKSTNIKLSTPFTMLDNSMVNLFRDMLGYNKIKITKSAEENKNTLYMGSDIKDTNKHIVFFSGGKESWYKIIYLTQLLNIPQEDILVIYVDKWNCTSGIEAKSLLELNKMFPKINIFVPEVSCSLPKIKAFALEYLLMIAASLEKIMSFNGGCNIHFGFSNISWNNKDTYTDSFSETMEAEKVYFKYLESFDIKLNPITRLEIKEYQLYDYELFNKYDVINKMSSCIVPDGLGTLSRNLFKKEFPELLEFVTDTECCYCTKCILKMINKLKFSEKEIDKNILIKLMNKHLDNKLLPIQKGKKDTQFYNYDIHLLAYLYQTFSDICKE